MPDSIGICNTVAHVGHLPRLPPASSGACKTPWHFGQVTLIGMNILAVQKG